MKAINRLYTIVFLFICSAASGQLKITDATTAPYSPENLISNVFLGSGVEILSIQLDGDKTAVGYFDGGLGNIGLERGIVLSTGYASALDDPNLQIDDDGQFTSGITVSDVDLANLASSDLEDIIKYTIQFIPTSDTLRFKYVFASEEYPNFVCKDFNDVFGFFISGPNPSGGNYVARNIALVPDPMDPTGLTFTNVSVAINNVHSGVENCTSGFPMYYNTNPIGTNNLSLNGYLDIFTAEAVVIPCETYTIKLVIGDVGDDIYNSAVFLEAKSFGTGSLNVSINTLSVDGSIAEGCGSGSLLFELPENVSQDYIIDFNLLNLGNSAIPGVDYEDFPNPLIIPAGSKSLTIPLNAIDDGLLEGNESITFEIQVDACNKKQFEILVKDDELFQPILPNDTLICEGENLTIKSSLDPGFILPDPPFFANDQSMDIIPEGTAIYSDITVSGVVPLILTPSLIESVCITGLEHRTLIDLDIFLIAPGGQFLELSTDNGFKINNESDIDRFENTCFTTTAVQNINMGNSEIGPIDIGNPTYTGNFLPEGVWSDLWEGENPSNGVWRLLVMDDFTGFTGTLEGWSITFRSFYNLTYEWTASTGNVSCVDCKDIEVNPEETTDYTLKIIDSYGCERSETITVAVAPKVEKPIANCNNSTQNTLSFEWNNISDIESFEVRINGSNWINVGLNLNYEFDNLNNDTEYILEVQAKGENCNSASSAIICKTLPCQAPEIIINNIVGTTCPASSDGQIIISATGLFPPFEFKIENEANFNGIFENLNQGSYTLFVKDAQNCRTSQIVDVPGVEPFAFDPSFELQNPCDLESNITGRLVVTGGTAPYNFSWDNGSTASELTNLSPGSYELTVTDFNSCTSNAFLNIPQFQSFDFDLILIPPTCNGGNDGKAIFNLLSGAEPIEILWSDNSIDIEMANLAAGDYQVMATDSLGCQLTKQFSIDSTEDLIVSNLFTDISCIGQNDGKAESSILSGKGPFTFIWDDVESSDSLINNLGPGNHTLIVRDAKGCEKNFDFDIKENIGIGFEVVKMDVLCSGTSQGRLNITASSQNGDVNINWNDGGIGFERINLPSGIYCFNLSDGTACQVDSCITIAQPGFLEINETLNKPSCNGGVDGSINLQISGGTEPYQYTWNGPISNIPNSSFISELVSGTYGITISDANNCQLVKALVLEENNLINIETIVTNVSCYGENTGAITVITTGGQGDFVYNWTGPDNFNATTSSINNLKAGMYDLEFKDSVGCENVYNFIVTQPNNALIANISDFDSICFASANGKLSVNPSGGTIPLDIKWNNGISSKDNFGLSPGQYSVTITDSRSCEVVETSQVVEKEQITIEVDRSPSTCFGIEDATAQIKNVKYGSQLANENDFNYLWNTSPVQIGLNAKDLKGGSSYSVIATDENGCTGMSTFTISSPDPVSAEVSNFSNVNCFGENDGSIEIIGTGGNGNYNYAWDASANSQIGAIANNLKKGNYAVTITDVNNCSGVKNFTIDEPQPIYMDFRIIDVSCFGDFSGKAEAIVEGGVGPYRYLWTNGAQTKSIENVPSDQYNITITDSNGCIYLDSTKINEPESPLMIDASVEDVICYNGRNGKIIIDAFGGSGFYQYSTDGKEFSSSKTISSLQSGYYSVIVRDFKGCQDTLEEIEVKEPSEIVVDLGNDKIIPFGASTVLNAKIYNAVGDITFKWNSNNLDLLSCTNCLSPTFDGQRESNFEFIVFDSNGCRGTDLISIRLENFSPFFVPTAFTPNNDGENDILLLFGVGIKKVRKFSIYDKWGALVYENEDFDVNLEDVGWDGIFRGEQAQSNLYFWFAEVEFANGFIETFNGNTTLIR